MSRPLNCLIILRELACRSKYYYAKKISKTETKISWTDSAQSIHRMVRAFTPWPGAWTFWKKEEKKIRFKILESEIIEKFNENSMCLNIGQSDRNLIVKCKKNYLKLKKIQLEGKKVISGDEFINGFKMFKRSLSLALSAL